MEMFALNKELDRLESVLSSLTGAARLEVLVALAWHLRQRDTRRSLAFADEADGLLIEFTFPESDFKQASSRILLIRGEAKWLFGGLAAAGSLAERALKDFALAEDYIGSADAHWLLAEIASDSGKMDQNASHLALAASHAQQSNDCARISITKAAIARSAILFNFPVAKTQWDAQFNSDELTISPSVNACVNDFLGLAAHQSSDFGKSVAHWLITYEASMQTGQIRRAITAATNIGDDFSNVGDHHAALEWVQRALEMARVTGWPVSIGDSLDATAATLRHLEQLEDALKLQRSALTTLTPLAGSRDYAIALRNFGDLMLDMADYRSALEIFRQLLDRAVALHQVDFQSMARRGMAHALLKLDRPEEALVEASHALTSAIEQSDLFRQIDALKVMAEIYSVHSLPYPPNMTAASPSLHYLLQAQILSNAIGANSKSSELLDAIAVAYANTGDYKNAFQSMQQSNEARKKKQSLESKNRAMAFKVVRNSEHARLAGERHLRLMQEEEK